MIEYAHEQDQIERLALVSEVVHLHLTKLNVLFESQFLCGPLRLLQVVRVYVDPGDLCSPACQLEAVVPGVASDIQCSPPIQSARQMGGKRAPLVTREVAQEMRRRGLDAVRQVK